jgi:hypothetical protein
MGFEQDGEHILIPTISDDGRFMDQDAAIAYYNRSPEQGGGRHLGKFRSQAEANAFSKKLSSEMGRILGHPPPPMR